MLFRFTDYILDSGRRELRCGDQSIEVEPQVLDLLIYLMQNRDRVVSKDDLIASVWGGRIVSDTTLTSRIYAARRAIGDSGRNQSLIRTIARKGLRFIGDVRIQADGEAAPAIDSSPIEVSGLSQSSPPFRGTRLASWPAGVPPLGHRSQPRGAGEASRRERADRNTATRGQLHRR